MLAWIGTTSSHSSLIISPISTPVPVIGCSWSVEASAEGVSGVSLLKQTPSKKQKAAALRDGGGGESLLHQGQVQSRTSRSPSTPSPV